MSALHWFAIRVTYSRELAFKSFLDEAHIENFIPMRYVYAERNGQRMRRLVPAVHNLVFVRASREQMDELDKRNIGYEVCPGVSSFCGAASALNLEYTLPNVSQSVIITRMAGRTPVPDKESIRSFAAHKATMVVFLSTGLLEELSKELIAGGQVQVNGEVCIMRGKKIRPGDKVTLAGNTVSVVEG